MQSSVDYVKAKLWDTLAVQDAIEERTGWHTTVWVVREDALLAEVVVQFESRDVATERVEALQKLAYDEVYRALHAVPAKLVVGISTGTAH